MAFPAVKECHTFLRLPLPPTHHDRLARLDQITATLWPWSKVRRRNGTRWRAVPGLRVSFARWPSESVLGLLRVRPGVGASPPTVLHAGGTIQGSPKPPYVWRNGPGFFGWPLSALRWFGHPGARSAFWTTAVRDWTKTRLHAQTRDEVRRLGFGAEKSTKHM